VSEGDGARLGRQRRRGAPPCPADPEDQLSKTELARLNEALTKGFESIKAGRFRAAADVIADLRRG
jgi:hypothetical protein